MDIVTVLAPPSKSMSHRAVIGAALADGHSLLHNVLVSDDLTRTMGCLSACGASFTPQDGDVSVTGVGGRPQGGKETPADLNVHESGTTCRLITAVVAAGSGRFRVHGAPRMHERPIAALARTLMAQDVMFSWEGREGYPPFILETKGLPGGELTIDVAESSQYLSGLLLAAPCARQESLITVGGDKVVSWPYVALTLQTLEDFDIAFAVEKRSGGQWAATPWKELDDIHPGQIRFRVPPGAYSPGERTVEGDWSNASYFLAAGAVGPAPVSVSGLRRDSLQGDRAMLAILEQMGADVSWQQDVVTVAPPPQGKLSGVTVDMSTCPDIVPTVAVAAALADSPTTITGVAHLRIKECDRLEAPAVELRKIGTEVEVLEDGLRITPHSLTRQGPLDFATSNDHRMAMSLAVLGRAGLRPAFDNPGCVAKSFPGFWDAWSPLVQAEEEKRHG